MMKGGESDGDKMALKRGWKSVGRRQKREALAEAGASFFVVCRMGGKRRFCRDFRFGNSFGYSVWEFTFESLGIQKVEMRGWMERG
ncbi:MAG: hypothetical protein SO359_05260 [Prevotella sp.]|nr:hypothetical protein [Prevotella sp.]